MAVVTRDQEIWGMALWVEQNHGPAAQQYIAEQVARLAEQGDPDGVKLWIRVKAALAELSGTGASRS